MNSVSGSAPPLDSCFECNDALDEFGGSGILVLKADSMKIRSARLNGRNYAMRCIFFLNNQDSAQKTEAYLRAKDQSFIPSFD